MDRLSYAPTMVAEAPLEQTETGLMPAGEGWFVLNAREARWLQRDGKSASCEFEGEREFPQVGIFLRVLAPGAPIAMYHWEADQEDFLVLSGEALLIIEGEERPLRQWDFVHCPPETKHIIVGAGDGPCVVLAVGALSTKAPPGGADIPWTRLRPSTAPASRRRRQIRSRHTLCYRSSSRRNTATSGYRVPRDPSRKLGPGEPDHLSRKDQ